MVKKVLKTHFPHLYSNTIIKNYLVICTFTLIFFFVRIFHFNTCALRSVTSTPSFDDYGREHLMAYLDACVVTSTVPELVWTFWFGSEMSPKRENALRSMESVLQVPVILLTKSNITQFLKWSVHPAFQYLSDNHKSDYLRIYFMLHYGGGYSDIKHMVEPWRDYFNEFKDPNVWIVGVPEMPGGVEVRPGINYPPDYYKSMISNGFMIARPNNRLLQEVHDIQDEILDKHSQALKENPSPQPRCCYGPPKGYPLRWPELMGENMALVAGKYIGHLSRKMAMPSLSDYL